MAICALGAAGLVLPAAAAARTDAPRAPARLDVPRDLRVVSYYPADAGWTRMWEPWRPARLTADLRRLRTLNANTVRVVVSPPFFGYPVPAWRYTDRLRELVEIASREGLHVQLTLFDWWDEYGDVAGSKRWARALLTPYIDDARIALVELRNELDAADAAALAWTRELVPWLRTLLRGRTPVTLSVGWRNALADLRTLRTRLPARSRPDFYTAHYFTGGGEIAGDTFRRLRDVVAPAPLWVGELGYPTSTTRSGYAGMPLTRSAQEAAQAHYLRLGFAAARRLGLPAPGIWILDDFVPGAIPASDVSPHEPEYTFGLFRNDGSAKPAAAVVRRLFGGGRDERFNGGFEQAVQGDDGSALPAAWSIGLDRLAVVRDTAVARTGSASTRISSPADVAGSALLTLAPVDGAPRPGRRAVLTAWLKSSYGTGRIRLRVDWFDGGDRRVGGSSRHLTMPSGGRWTPLAVSSRPPPEAAFARIAVEAWSFGGTAWVDDVDFAWR